MDVRSQRTRKKISDCFLHLLREKPASKITVTEICEMASINRATFYKHYQDVPELLEQQVEEVLLRLKSLLDSLDCQKMDEMILEMLRYMRAEGKCCYVLGSSHGDPNLAMKSFELCYQRAFPVLQRNFPGLSAERTQMLYFYLSQACGGVVTWWLRSGMALPPEEVAEFILDASIGTVKAFLPG